MFLFSKGLIIYSIFIPLKLFAINFYVGTIVYLLGLVLTVNAMYTFFRSELSKPVTKGIYKMTRHPM